MRPANDDQMLRRLFRALREENRRATPPFQRIWRKAVAAQERRRRPWRVPWFRVAGGVTAVGTILMVWLYLQPLSEQPPTAVTMIAFSDWRSPTTFLLDYPGQDLLGNISGLGKSAELYDLNTPTSKF